MPSQEEGKSGDEEREQPVRHEVVQSRGLRLFRLEGSNLGTVVVMKFFRV